MRKMLLEMDHFHPIPGPEFNVRKRAKAREGDISELVHQSSERRRYRIYRADECERCQRERERNKAGRALLRGGCVIKGYDGGHGAADGGRNRCS